MQGLAMALPGIAVDGKRGEKLIIAGTTASDGNVYYGVWILTGEGASMEARFICDVLGEEEYQALYEFFEPLSEGDIVL